MNDHYILRKYIQKKLVQFCKNSFYKNADKNTTFPYVTYEINHLRREDIGKTVGTLEIDCWGKKEQQLLDLATAIENTLDMYTVEEEPIYIRFFKDNFLSVEDDDYFHVRLNISFVFFKETERN